VCEVLIGHEVGVVTSFSGLVGAIWRINEDVSLDMGVRIGRDGNQRLGELRAGLTWTIPLSGRL
jgi:hypothetical protein